MESILDIDLENPLDLEAIRGLNNLLSVLERRELAVIDRRFGLTDGKFRTLKEVGDEFEITRERVRQLQDKALRKLRHPAALRGAISRWSEFSYSSDFSDVFPKGEGIKRLKKFRARKKREQRKWRKALEKDYAISTEEWEKREVPAPQIPEWVLDYTILSTPKGSLRIPYRNVVKFIERPRTLAKQIVIAMDKRGYARVGVGVHVKIHNHQEITIRTCDNTEDPRKFFIVVSRR